MRKTVEESTYMFRCRPPDCDYVRIIRENGDALVVKVVGPVGVFYYLTPKGEALARRTKFARWIRCIVPHDIPYLRGDYETVESTTMRFLEEVCRLREEEAAKVKVTVTVFK